MRPCLRLAISAVRVSTFRVSAVPAHYPLQFRNPVPPFPARDSETCYTARSGPNTTRPDPHALHTHTCPPTMPRPPTMSTCSELNVPFLPQANFAPRPAGSSPKSADLSAAAPPAHSGMRPAMQPMPAPPAPGSVSCHEMHAAVAALLTSCAQNDISCAFSRQKRLGTDSGRILLRESMPMSCHEKTENFSKLGQTGQNKQFDTLSIPCRYPVSQKSAAPLATQYDALGSILDRFGRILDRMRGLTDKETDATIDFDPDLGTRRRNDPQRGPRLGGR